MQDNPYDNSNIHLYRYDNATGQRSRILIGRDVEQLKQRARKLKREKGLTHTEALDRVAQDVGFNHWHHVTECYQHTKPAETALREGCVLLFRWKDLEDVELDNDNVFVEDEWLETALHKTLYTTFIDFPDEDDPEGRPLKITTKESELEALYEEWNSEGHFAYLRVSESSAGLPLDKIMAMVQERFLWPPIWIVYHGTVVDTYHLPAKDNNGNVVGVRF